MKKFDKDIKGLLLAGIISLIVCIICVYVSYQRNERIHQEEITSIQTNLNATTTELDTTYDELAITKDNLKLEIEKNDALSKELGVIRKTLDEANMTIADLTASEYEFVYLGEFKLTAYCSCEACCGYWATVREKDEYGNEIVDTASGALARANHTIAVDTAVLPFGTEVYIYGLGWYTAEDTGSAVKGKHIDIYYDDHNVAAAQGVQYKDVWMLVKKS